MTDDTKTKKPPATRAKRKSKLTENFVAVSNLPPGGQIAFNAAEFVQLFRNDIIKKCFKKPAGKDQESEPQ